MMTGRIPSILNRLHFMSSLDWQTVVAIGCVALAATWWLRRAMKWATGDGSCASGCGKCGTDIPPPDRQLVQLSEDRTVAR